MMLALDTRVMRRTWTALDQELIGRVIYATQLPCLCEAIYHGTGFRELRRPPSFAILGNDDQVLLHDRQDILLKCVCIIEMTHCVFEESRNFRLLRTSRCQYEVNFEDNRSYPTNSGRPPLQNSSIFSYRLLVTAISCFFLFLVGYQEDFGRPPVQFQYVLSSQSFLLYVSSITVSGARPVENLTPYLGLNSVPSSCPLPPNILLTYSSLLCLVVGIT